MKLTSVSVRRVSNGYYIDTNWDWEGKGNPRPMGWDDPKFVIQDGVDVEARLGEEIVRLFATPRSQSGEPVDD